jgi:1-acyl-sn-glycerol-3-phosphate acyltransferase
VILLRSTLFNLWFYGVTLVYAFFGMALLLVGKHTARRWAKQVGRFWAASVMAGLRPLVGITYVVTGREHLPASGPALIASMHQSAFDTMLWLVLTRDPAYVLKKELLRVPLFGMMCRLTGMIAVDRSAGASAIRELMRGADMAMGEGRPIVIFPEGTRMPPGQVGVLQPGIVALASRTKLPIIPVVTDSGFCWSRRAFRKLPGVINVDIRPPLPAGTPRSEILPLLDEIYRHGSAELAGRPVDKSVDSTFRALRPGGSDVL